MSKFDSAKVMRRYTWIAAALTLMGLLVLGKAGYIMGVEKDYWDSVAARLKKDSVAVMPNRGNILSCDGQLMASTLPEYKVYMDFVTCAGEQDTLWPQKVDSLCHGLSMIFPERSAEEFKRHLEEGHRKMSRNWPVWPRRIDYNTFCQVRDLPLFNLTKKSRYKGGFHWEEYNARRRPFGSLAQRTVGDMYGAIDSARCGLELAFDSILRGTSGLTHRRKILNKYLNVPIAQPIDGADIVTTIDVGIQDLAERALIEELKLPEVHGDVGVAIVMEVKTGDIKAIVNMTKCADGVYREVKNNAVSDLLEPGSVFKTASILVALDDGKVDTTKKVDTGCGIYNMYGRDMKDHNWRNGGYQVISLPRTLEVSSNIGVSRIIDENYHNAPERYVEGIYRTGLADDLHLPFFGASKARIRMPKKNGRGQWLNWSNTALAWMSIGYETQVPPMSTVTFYNAIANGGKMMRPRFVKRIVKDGKVVEEFPPVVQRERIAKPSTIKTMQTILTHVVSQGLGKKAGSPSFLVAGKTGTAQISQGKAGYKSGMTHYLLSFAGFFPADNPRYSCIVCIQKGGLPASGGGMSGVVFRHIAEGVMARDLKLSVDDARDANSLVIPDVKGGNVLAADYVLGRLGVKTDAQWEESAGKDAPVWGKAEHRSDGVALTRSRFASGVMPDVTGMGASDAVFLLESRGLKVRLLGRGRVVQQSYPAGKALERGRECVLTLKN